MSGAFIPAGCQCCSDCRQKAILPRRGRIALSANERIAEFLNFAIQAKFAYVNRLRGLNPLLYFVLVRSRLLFFILFLKRRGQRIFQKPFNIRNELLTAALMGMNDVFQQRSGKRLGIERAEKLFIVLFDSDALFFCAFFD